MVLLINEVIGRDKVCHSYTYRECEIKSYSQGMGYS